MLWGLLAHKRMVVMLTPKQPFELHHSLAAIGTYLPLVKLS